VTHIVASNLTPKKRAELERYKVVRPEWIVDCVKAGKALSWNQYRLIDRSNQKTIGITQRAVDSYRAVSSREEKTVYGGGGLHTKLSQESSSYPTPPEMKAMDLDAVQYEAKTESPEKPLWSDAKGEETQMLGIEFSSDVSPITISPANSKEAATAMEIEIPSTLSPLEISSPLQQPRTPTKSNIDQNIDPPDELEPSSPRPEDLVESPKVAAENKAALAAAHNAAILANPSLRSSTVVNPDFLKSYFDQSRLHHLSAWKADLKNQMQQLTSQNPRPLKRTGARCIMHVDFDCFFCSVSLVSRPELKEKPVCVGHGGARSGEISSCNYPARKFGIHNGMR
jgi:DNA repair protein REV1